MANVELIFGDASFTGPKSLLIRLNDGGERVLAADKIFINAGARPSVPAIEGLKSVPFFDSTSIMELDKVPDHLLVLGGGYVGLEFGQMFRRFGSRVTIVQAGKQLLNREDPRCRLKKLPRILQQDGVEVLLNATANRVSQSDGSVRLEVQHEGRSSTLAGSHLLVATGRTPNTDTLSLLLPAWKPTSTASSR